MTFGTRVRGSGASQALEAPSARGLSVQPLMGLQPPAQAERAGGSSGGRWEQFCVWRAEPDACSHSFVSLFFFLLQFPPSGDFLHSPKLRPSQGTPGSEELFFSRKRPPRNLFQNSVDFNSEHSSVCAGKY